MSTERRRFDEIGKRVKRESDVSNSSQMGRRHISSGTTLNTITPCAACKLLRRRCAEECPFSPYFSPHEPQKFASVHKVFGASNVSKMLMEVPESQRADAANSLVFEANLRLRDPVYGCMGTILALQQQVQVLSAELDAVRAEILRYKYKEASNNANTINPSCNNLFSSEMVSIVAPSLPQPSPPPPPPPPSVVVSSSSISSLYTAPTTTSTTGFSSISSDNNVPYFN